MWRSQVRGCEKGKRRTPSPPYSLFFRTRLQFRSLRLAFENERLLRILMFNENDSFSIQNKENGVLVSLFV